MQKDRQTDRHDETNSEFRSFAKAHKNDETENFEGVPNKLNVFIILSTDFLQENKIHE